jgi:hypothetical protein
MDDRSVYPLGRRRTLVVLAGTLLGGARRRPGLVAARVPPHRAARRGGARSDPAPVSALGASGASVVPTSFRLYTDRAVAGGRLALSGLGATAVGAVALLPLFVQGALSRSATSAGAALTPLLASISTGIVAGQVGTADATRVEIASALHGSFLAGLGMGSLAFVGVLLLPHVVLRERLDERAELGSPARAR